MTNLAMPVLAPSAHTHTCAVCGCKVAPPFNEYEQSRPIFCSRCKP